MKVFKVVTGLLAAGVLGACGSSLSSSPKSADPSTLRATGGTTTDNPMQALKVSFSAYQAPVTFSFCSKSTSLVAASALGSGGFVTGRGNGNGNGNIGNGNGNGNGNGPGVPSFNLSGLGGFFQSFDTTQGFYNQFLIQLGTGCAGGKSIEVENAYGKFALVSEGSLRFAGAINVSASASALQLNLSNYALALSEARSETEVAQILASTAGTF